MPCSFLRIAEKLFTKGSNIKTIQIRRKNENLRVEYIATKVIECISRPRQKKLAFSLNKKRWSFKILYFKLFKNISKRSDNRTYA
ncbi:hypothetical protein JCM31447_20100 [Fluviispira sanaruensis]|uniref:Uncharacterized protein n=1 Tax=Fluviispira sanaruensis TaxID=2493639 RepID=A0A4P2VK22_FLUSA|nr:hypothetical protein JCM31447_20100 [Fluviispira sanaruensis]